MNYQKFTTLLKNQASSLSYGRQLEFAITISKKLCFDYQKFFEVYQWGDPDLLMDAINLCQLAAESNIDKAKVKTFITKVESITPDMDDFGTEIVSYALNASASVHETLEFLVDRDSIHIYNIGTYYTDTTDFKIQEEGTLTDRQISNHPAMIEAWNYILELTK
jgi:uncharacterized protein YjaG (DUF416 family)